jgi:hypothetical protein
MHNFLSNKHIRVLLSAFCAMPQYFRSVGKKYRSKHIEKLFLPLE